MCIRDRPSDAVRHTYDTGEKAREQARRIIGDSIEFEATGLSYLFGDWLDDIVAGQRRGLLFAIVSIAIMMIIGLRSISVGLWSMIPNLFPLMALGGYLGLFWEAVDSDTLMLAMIAIGIGVDDTIHFLMRLRIEAQRQPTIDKAIDETFHFSGRGIVITTVILVAGFAPFALSNYLSVWMLGSLLPMTLVVALLADLLLLPALVKLGIIKYRKRRSA